MPHLTRSGGPRWRVGGPEFRPGLGVAGYAHPMVAPAEWAELCRPGLPLHWVVLGSGHGPGSRPDPYCRPAVAGLHGAGVSVLGELDMRFGGRPFAELVSDAHRYLDWYRVEGFYLARCPSQRGYLPEFQRTVTLLRALAGEEGRIVAGHGMNPPASYAEWADQLVTFSGSWAEYRFSQAAEWTAEYAPERFCHLVHSVPLPHLEEALRIARWQGAGTVWVTDRTDRAGLNPWETLPGYWDEIVSRFGTGVSE